MESCHQCHGIPYHVPPSHIHIISHMFIPFIYCHMVHDITIFWMKPNLPGADEIWWDSVVPALQPNFWMLMQQPIFQHSAHGLKDPGRDKVRKSRRFSWVTTALTAKKKTQVCSSTVYKMQDTLYASISFCSKAGIHAWYQGWWP